MNLEQSLKYTVFMMSAPRSMELQMFGRYLLTSLIIYLYQL